MNFEHPTTGAALGAIVSRLIVMDDPRARRDLVLLRNIGVLRALDIGWQNPDYTVALKHWAGRGYAMAGPYVGSDGDNNMVTLTRLRAAGGAYVLIDIDGGQWVEYETGKRRVKRAAVKPDQRT